MRKYRIELHSHTSETSPCGQVNAVDLIELYVNKGYDGIVITDHFSESIFPGLKDTESILSKFLAGYKNAVISAQDRIKVYLGVELRLNESFNDYLIYGDVMNLLKHGRDIFNLSLKELYERVKEYNLALFQAHPFRNHMERVSLEYIDGIEVYNLHTEHNSRNYKSVDYAKQNSLLGISGSDCHKVHHAGRGGIFTDALPNNEKELKDLILSKDFNLIF